MNNLDKIKWGGSGIEKVVFDYIRKTIPEGSVIIELGAGHVSTQALSAFYKLYSVEHNPDFANLYEGVNYILTELKDGWYDVEVLKGLIPANPAMVIIDGCNRHGILEHMDLFKCDVYLIHDTYREKEIELAHLIGKRVGREPQFFTEGDYWAVI